MLAVNWTQSRGRCIFMIDTMWQMLICYTSIRRVLREKNLNVFSIRNFCFCLLVLCCLFVQVEGVTFSCKKRWGRLLVLFLMNLPMAFLVVSLSDRSDHQWGQIIKCMFAMFSPLGKNTCVLLLLLLLFNQWGQFIKYLWCFLP